MHKSKMHGLQYIILRQNYIISWRYRDSYCMRMQHPFHTDSTLTSHDSTSPACLDPTTPVSLDRSALSQQDLIPVPIMTAKSTSSLSVSFSSSTGVLCTTSTLSLSTQTPNWVCYTSLKTSLAQTILRLLYINKQMKKKTCHSCSCIPSNCTQILQRLSRYLYTNMRIFTHTHKGGKILSSSNQSRYLATRSECPVW